MNEITRHFQDGGLTGRPSHCDLNLPMRAHCQILNLYPQWIGNCGRRHVHGNQLEPRHRQDAFDVSDRVVGIPGGAGNNDFLQKLRENPLLARPFQGEF